MGAHVFIDQKLAPELFLALRTLESFLLVIWKVGLLVSLQIGAMLEGFSTLGANEWFFCVVGRQMNCVPHFGIVALVTFWTSEKFENQLRYTK